MECWRVWFDNGAAILVVAESQDDAKMQAEADSAKNGYAGLRVVRVEMLERY